jgi:hypothetical protein
MTRIGTGLSVAVALGCMATLGAQTPQTPPTSTTDQRSAMSEKARDITVSGCLAKSADGRYMLSNAKMDPPASSSTASTAAGTSTTAGTTGTTNPAGATASTTGGMNAGATLALVGGSDLDKHVGHKIQVTGRSAWDGSKTAAAMPPAGTATGTTGSTTPTPATGAAAADQPRVDVDSVKMIAASCS